MPTPADVVVPVDGSGAQRVLQRPHITVLHPTVVDRGTHGEDCCLRLLASARKSTARRPEWTIQDFRSSTPALAPPGKASVGAAEARADDGQLDLTSDHDSNLLLPFGAVGGPVWDAVSKTGSATQEGLAKRSAFTGLAGRTRRLSLAPVWIRR
jgi:hypothetical protein